MVQVIDINKEEFKELISHKRLICFGMGKRLQLFIAKNPGVSIDGIVDNYRYGETTCYDYNGKRIPIWSPREFEKNEAGENIILVVTALAIEEVVEQLDEMDELNQVPCCVEAVLDNYEAVDNKKLELMETVSRLVQRTEQSVAKENFAEANMCQSQKRYQIWEYFGASNTGGSKARTDIKSIAGNMGYQVQKVHASVGIAGTSQADCSDRLVRAEWLRFLNRIPEDTYILMQHPAPWETRLPEDILLRIKREKKARIICLVHEVEELRKEYDTELRREEFRIMKNLSDVFIVHNEAMKQFYVSRGVDAGKVIPLYVFDYLDKNKNIAKRYEKSITIAGNLNLEKSAYLRDLGKLSPLKIHLYGPNFSEEITEGADNVEYYGSVAPDVLSRKLDRGFGLVWDGESIETCAGGFGEYLRYNNPHKLSLYLSSGLPVIIWSQAAEADFVTKHKVGIVVDSLYEINAILNKIMPEEYAVFAENAEKLSGMLKTGEFTRKAIGSAEAYLENLWENGFEE